MNSKTVCDVIVDGACSIRYGTFGCEGCSLAASTT
jgi:hypothetical protein